jgi:hypothetical protein
MIKLYHVWMDTDIDKYEYVTLTDPRPIESYENIDIKEIDSLYHFFEVVNIEQIENGRTIFLDLLTDFKEGRLFGI